MVFTGGPSEGCDELIEAVGERDADRFRQALQQIAVATQQSGPAEVDAALMKLLPILTTVSYGAGADLAKLAGAMTDFGADAAVLLPVLARRAAEAMEQAARFAAVYGSVAGGEWVQPVLYLAQRKDVRAALPERERLTTAIAAVQEHIGKAASWLGMVEPPKR